MAVRNALSDAYRARLTAGVNVHLARLAAAWLALWDPRRPLYSAGLAGELTAAWTEALQGWAAEETAAYLYALTLAAGVGGPRFGVPPGLVGSSAAGGFLRDMTRLAPAVWLARLAGGSDQVQATAGVVSWLAALASSEPYRAANQTAVWNARRDPRMTGLIIRITRAGACPFCVTISVRGYTEAAAGFPAHAHCRCTAEPQVRRAH